MNTILLPTSSPTALSTAIDILQKGGLVALPTDTVYGLAAMVTDGLAIDRLYQAKERSPQKAIAVLIGSMDQIDRVVGQFSAKARRLALRFWPGALTLVLPQHPGLPANLSPTPTIGVRMPDHSFTLDLLRQAGPLATTSANISGGLNPQDASDVLAQLDGRIELVLDGGPVPGGVPSTVVDCTGENLVILREGAIPASQILNDLIS
jgi:L-threonylcarbamoyladenylate synthase